MPNTPFLQVSNVLESTDRITLFIAQPYKAELYLAAIFIIKAGTGVSGNIARGSGAYAGGSAFVNVSPQLFASLDIWASQSLPLHVSLKYEGTLVKDIIYTKLQPVGTAAELDDQLARHISVEAASFESAPS